MDAGGSPADKAHLAAERKRSRLLEKELLRKGRALAEAAALLTSIRTWDDYHVGKFLDPRP